MVESELLCVTEQFGECYYYYDVLVTELVCPSVHHKYAVHMSVDQIYFDLIDFNILLGTAMNPSSLSHGLAKGWQATKFEVVVS